MIDFLNSPAIGSLNWGDVLIGIPAAIVAILISLAVIGAFIGFLLTEKYRRDSGKER